MKKLSLFLLSFVLIAYCANAQIMDKALIKNKAFTGALSAKKHFRAIYQLDNSDPKIIEKTIRNINNALTDPRLADKIEIELIAFGGGTDA